MRKWLCLLVCFLTLTAGVVQAAPDLSTPKSAAIALHEAIEQADPSAIAQVLSAQTDDQKALALSIAGLIAAGRRLQTAALKRWGESARPLVEDMTAADELRQIDRATVSQKGDRAELTLPDATRPVIFVRTNGQWRLDVLDYLAGNDIARLRTQTQLLNRVAGVLGASAADIAGGKYRSPDAAREDLLSKLNRAMQ